jgi:MoaA/NifB/PqqE/SkfB family radical SAM enzyme
LPVNIKAFLNTLANTSFALPIVIFFVTAACNLKCLTCSYRKPLPDELSFDELKKLAIILKKFGLKHIVYSGGEPLIRNDFFEICKLFYDLNIKQTLLTNGLLLFKSYNRLNGLFKEIIVSIDGADSVTHNYIRGVNSFDLIIKGINCLKSDNPMQQISIRTVLQKNNFRQLPEFINLAKNLNVNRISFLAADLFSNAYGRELFVHSESQSDNDLILLNHDEVTEFKNIIRNTFQEFKSDFNNGFVSESEEKLMKIADYYSAVLSKNFYPKNICNAPKVSAVLTSNGELMPCFFLPSVGNIRKFNLKDLLNSKKMKNFRELVKNMSLTRCKQCVCTLYVSPFNALMDKF